MKIKASHFLAFILFGIINMMNFALADSGKTGFPTVHSGQFSTDTAQIMLLNNQAVDFYNADANDSCIKYASMALKISDALLQSAWVNNDKDYLIQSKKLKAISLKNIAIGMEGSNTPAAIDTLQNALKIILHAGETITEASIYATMGNIYNFSGQTDLALENDLKALEIYRKSNDKRKFADQLTTVAVTQRNIGKYGDAMENLDEALKISRQISDSSTMVEALLAMGFVYLFVERYDDALNVQNEALKIIEKMGDSLGIARIYNDMGVAKMRAGNLDASLKMHQKALAIRSKSTFAYYIYASYLYIGNIYEKLQKYPEAVENYTEGLKYALIVGYKLPIIDNHLNLGGAYLKIPDMEKAMEHFKIAFELSHEIGNRTSEATASLNIAKIYRTWNNTSAALEWLRKAEKAAPKSDLMFIGDIYHYIAEIYYTMGDFEKAYTNMMIYNQVKDSIMEAVNIEKVTTITNKLAFENKLALQNESNAKILQIKQSEIDRQKIQRNFMFFGMGGVLVLAIIFIFRFIEKNKLNAKLNKLLIDLKSTQSQLIQSEKMASLGELTAGIAHEIQNPLNFVNNFSEVSNELIDEMKEEFKKGYIDEVIAIADDIKQNLEKINHHGKRADAIVKGMLQHSRTNKGQKEPTDLNALADEYLRLSYHGLRAKDKSFNANFETDFDPDLPKIEVIPQDIGRVLLNLINNAFYACAERSRSAVHDKTIAGFNPAHAGLSELDDQENYEPLVTVKTKKLGDHIEISVSDNGNGIPDKVKDKIFQPFFTTKPTGEGTGLGLSLSYDIVTKGHGGTLRMESKEGEGTRFIIELSLNIEKSQA
ncbi:MAG: tetratricopeptide repeat protein [Bacteroidales bacterium]|nr:tetratricopeptide repeat protein [Bacteroidales bacterium]